ncbi:MAG TPA: hypothetical protein VF182_08410 [Candidatus Binatia bacterium]
MKALALVDRIHLHFNLPVTTVELPIDDALGMMLSPGASSLGLGAHMD